MFLNISVLQGRVVSTSPNPQAGGQPLVGCPRLLIQFIRSYPPYPRPFLHPQPEDAPCRGDRDPLHGDIRLTVNNSSAKKKTATRSDGNNNSVVPVYHRVYPGTISRINTHQIRKTVRSHNTSENLTIIHHSFFIKQLYIKQQITVPTQ